jgi:OCT family organic anion transporter-like MFS transporter 6
MGSTMARVGSIVSPLVSMTSELYPTLPLFIYGAVPVAASAATALLPETLGQPLPDTVQDLENRWALTQRGAGTYPRSHIQAGVAETPN